ncbi:hypothetical protein [Clostridium aminobutyricum]|uniref:Uncharacterized protein n=1 Tax=Clostridium aminobutyricum TaxID=33953 RepID=A0A939IHZ8_CLOAM|nr:hypothetical protein [Clostridium aminobutyricum]MBN7772063.1 hypothetical protein [Clostridium aminobutyricum]
MKVFIVFVSLLIVYVSALVYQGDLGRYVHEQVLLKEAAEECAAGAALLMDKEEYANGKMVFDYEAGQKYAQEYLEYIKRNSRVLSAGEVDYKIEFEDDKIGYFSSNTDKIPAVTVEIKVLTEDLFKLPFLNVTSLERRARYELPE